MKVSLRPRHADDRERVLGWRNRDDVRSSMFDDHVISAREHAGWFERSSHDPTRVDWIITLDDEPVGAAALTQLDRRNLRSSWTIYLGEPEARGRALGTAAEYLVATYVFERLRLHRLACEVLAGNEAAVSLYSRFGFSVDGVLRDFCSRDDTWVDVLTLSMLEHEWPPARDRAARRLAERGITTPDPALLAPAPADVGRLG